MSRPSHYTLYHSPLARSTRVKWMLYEIFGEDFDTFVTIKRINLHENEQYSDEFRKINPHSNIPVLFMEFDNGQKPHVMLESAAIVEFLAELYPEKGFAPPLTDLGDRAEYLQWLHYAGGWMDKILYEMRTHMSLLAEDKRHPPTVERFREMFEFQVEPHLTKHLKNRKYMCGECFTAVDLVMAGNLMWASQYELATANDTLIEYRQRVLSRPAFAKAYDDLTQFVESTKGRPSPSTLSRL